MALTFSVNAETPCPPHEINKHWVHKFDDEHYLITTEHGAWVCLNSHEFRLFKMDKLEEDLSLFSILENKGIIITQDNQDKLANMYKMRFNRLFTATNLHIITPTLRCNQGCFYCYPYAVHENAKGYDMDKKTAKATIDFIFQSPSPYLTIEFTGGEPLLNFPMIELMIERAKKINKSKEADENGWWNGIKKITFQLVTNLTLMDEEKLEYLMMNKAHICTSLDGPKEIHDKNRPWVKGSSHQKVTFWINKMKNELKYPFFSTAMPTVTRYTFPHVRELVDEYIKLGLNHISFRPIFIAGRAEQTWDKIGYTAEEFVEAWKNYLEYILELNRKGVNIVGDDIIILLRRIVTLQPSSYTCLGAPCGACITQAGYNQWGDVFTCDEGKNSEVFKLGNVKENSYKEVFTSKNALNFIGLTSTVQDDSSPWHAYSSPCHVSSYGQQKNLITKIKQDYILEVHNLQIEHMFRKLIFSPEDTKIMMNWTKNSSI